MCSLSFCTLDPAIYRRTSLSNLYIGPVKQVADFGRNFFYSSSVRVIMYARILEHVYILILWKDQTFFYTNFDERQSDLILLCSVC